MRRLFKEQEGKSLTVRAENLKGNGANSGTVKAENFEEQGANSLTVKAENFRRARGKESNRESREF